LSLCFGNDCNESFHFLNQDQQFNPSRVNLTCICDKTRGVAGWERVPTPFCTRLY